MYIFMFEYHYKHFMANNPINKNFRYFTTIENFCPMQTATRYFTSRNITFCRSTQQ